MEFKVVVLLLFPYPWVYFGCTEFYRNILKQDVRRVSLYKYLPGFPATTTSMNRRYNKVFYCV